MKWFQNAATRTKLLFAFGLMLVLIGGVFCSAFFAISSLIASQKDLFDNRFNQVIDALNFDSNEGEIRATMITMALLTNRAEMKQLQGVIDDKSKEANQLLTRLINQNRDNPKVLQRLEDWRSLRDSYKTTRETEVIPALEEGQFDKARDLLLSTQADRFRQMRAITGQLVDESKTEVRSAITLAERRGYQLLSVAAAVTFVSLVLGVVMVRYMNRLLAYPLQMLLGWTEKTASGDLSVEIPETERRDEVGVLQEAFRRMLENLRTMTRDIQESVNVLASSATQILTATSQMAATANETATASNQTTSTVEEVKQTAQVSSGKSRQVAEIAQRAARDADTGRASVDESIEGMNRIRTQMEAIADSIVRLSEQGQAIGEIISSVNDLAEQSNLLAVNAAIEAAKAGEQGKGFAVVAQEIRSLAAQSKQATGQVRTILGDIQKATTSAVTAANQGTTAVENGVHQSAQAGEVIRALAESINQAAEAARQISASSEQQSIGMDQVAQAMENIKQAAGQNAGATKQVESGARNLHELGQKLQLLVRRFKM